MKKIKILCLIGQLGNGGSEKQLYLFLKYLNRDKYSPLVILSSDLYIEKWKEKIEGELNIPVKSLSKYPGPAKFAIFKLMLWKERPGIIFSWSFYTNPFIAVSGGIPFIASLRGGIEEERAELSNIHFKLALKPKRFIVNSQKLVNELLKENIDNDKIHLIKNIFEISEEKSNVNVSKEIREKYNIPKDSIIISGGGRDSDSKDFPLWLDAFEIALKKHSNITAILFGHGPEKIIGDEVRKRGIEKSIIFTGDLPDVSPILQASEIFFLSSLYEGLPNIVLEAIDAKATLLSTDTAGIRDILDGIDSEILNNIVTPDRDPQSVGNMLIALIEDKKLRDRIKKSTSNILNKFNPIEKIKEYCDVIEYMLI